MRYFANSFKMLLLLSLLAPVLEACGEGGDVPADPEEAHCRKVAAKLAQAAGTIRILDSRAWTLDDVRNVRVRFEYPPETPDMTVGSIMCTYDFSIETRSDARRKPVAASVFFRGRTLSTNELLLLNTAIRAKK